MKKKAQNKQLCSRKIGTLSRERGELQFNIGANMMKSILFSTLLMLTIILTISCGPKVKSALFVHAVASQGAASPGNLEPANFLVLVTDYISGAPVTNLKQSNFIIINHFSIPGATCGFSNSITFFGDVGTGAYQINVGLPKTIPGCSWVQGDYLAQVIVNAGSRKGQATATLSIK